MPNISDMARIEELRELLHAAEQGNVAAVDTLKASGPVLDELCQHASDLAQRAESAQLDLASCGDTSVREALVKKLVDLKQKLAGPSPSTLESLLIERIASTWLQACHADCMVAQCAHVDIKWQRFLQQRADRASKNLQHAVKNLAIVRQLLNRANNPKR